jgi:5-methylcytosine-specific restriction endonuclease McrA
MTDQTIPPMQACRKCGEEKPHTDEFYHRADDGRGKKLLQRICRVCRNAANREYQNRRWVEDHDRLLERNRAYVQRNADRVREWEASRPDRSAYNREHKQKRREELTATDKAAINEKLKAWKRANPEKVREHWERTYQKNRERRLAYVLDWARRNPEKRIAIRDRRRAREVGAEGSYTADDVRELLRTQGRVCRYCQSKLTIFHVDHFIPLARGGSNWPSNLVLSCPPCNYSKSDRMPWVWKPEMFSPP